MNILWQVVYLLLWLFRLALLGRIVIEFVRVFARSWRPAGAAGRCHGGALREHGSAGQAVPEDHSDRASLGGVGFDLSIVVLLILVYVLMEIVMRSACPGRALASPSAFSILSIGIRRVSSVRAPR